MRRLIVAGGMLLSGSIDVLPSTSRLIFTDVTES